MSQNEEPATHELQVSDASKQIGVLLHKLL